eukprot:TRINITY_DN4880_c0_g1_i2.p1 TRINITY_DN4880_c0_g1~~TRINITY_DN4880_c0_g1_i2.p1  ORF type:complete len:567 (+),score=161.86 TRINITY_DN4880_c0_g1_i2:131-1831(+)
MGVRVQVTALDTAEEGNTVTYTFLIKYKSQKQWTMEKRFSEFEEMHKLLAKRIANIAYLPAKSLLPLGYVEVQKRKKDLETYLNATCNREDCLNVDEFREFIDLESFVEYSFCPPAQIFEIKNLPMSVCDMIFLPTRGVLILGLRETSIISKMESYFTMKLFGKKNENNNQKVNTDPMGAVLLYIESPLGSYNFTKLWRKNFGSGVSCIEWDDDLALLGVGLEDGTIECLSLAPEHNFENYDEFCIVKRHTDTVNDMAFLGTTGTLYSVSKDKHLILTEMNRVDTYFIEEKIFTHELTGIILDKENKRIFVSDSQGSIHIYSLESKRPAMIFLHSLKQEGCNIRTIVMDPDRKFLLAGSSNGMVLIFQIGKPGKEKLSQLVSSIETSKNIRSIGVILNTKELFVAGGAPNVQMIHSNSGQHFYALPAHEDNVEKIILLGDERVIISGSKDRSVKGWKLPSDWRAKRRQSTHVATRTSTASKVSEGEGENKRLSFKNPIDIIYSTLNPAKDAPASQKSHDDNEEDEPRRQTPPSHSSNYVAAVTSNKTKPPEEDDDDDLSGWNSQIS